MSGDEGGSEASGRSGDSLTLHATATAAATVPLAAARKDAPPPKAKSSGGKATGVSALVPLLLRGAAHVLAGRAVVTALSLAAVCSKLLIADVLPTHLARSDYHWPAQAGGIRGVDKKAKVHNTTAEGAYPLARRSAIILRVSSFLLATPSLAAEGAHRSRAPWDGARRRDGVTQSGVTGRALHGPREHGGLGAPTRWPPGSRAVATSKARSGNLGECCRAVGRRGYASCRQTLDSAQVSGWSEDLSSPVHERPHHV